MTRKRKRNPNKWADNAVKEARNHGLHYKSSSRTAYKKTMRSACVNCRFHCSQKVSSDERRKLFDDFWGLGDHTRQWDYLDKCVITNNDEVEQENRSRTNGYRQVMFLLPSKTIKVCMTMFLNTFGN